MGARFLDTNVLLYLLSSDPVRADRAEALLADDATISVQVLNELTNVARRKIGLSWPEVHAFLTMVRSLVTVVPVTIGTHETGLFIAERYGQSTYDAMIVAAALQANCATLFSEDMQDGLQIDGRLWIINPFRPPHP